MKILDLKRIICSDCYHECCSVTGSNTVDFSNLVDQVSPAVVSVSVVKKMSEEELLQQQVPEILRRFFGNQVIIPQPRTAGKPDMGVPSSLVRMAIC